MYYLIIKPRIIFPTHSLSQSSCVCVSICQNKERSFFCKRKMQEMIRTTEDQQHLPPGYPAAEQASEQPGQDKKKKTFKTKQKGDRGFIEGCLFALCCCWICEMCF